MDDEPTSDEYFRKIKDPYAMDEPSEMGCFTGDIDMEGTETSEFTYKEFSNIEDIEEYVPSTHIPDHWKRPAVVKSEVLIFQQMSADYYIKKNKPIVRFYGVTKESNSVVLHVHGCEPYFYVALLPGIETKEHVYGLTQDLNKATSRYGQRSYVKKMEFVEKTLLWGYQFGKLTKVLKITTHIPGNVSKLRTLFTEGVYITGHGTVKLQTYESNILFPLRCMVDLGIQGSTWISVKCPMDVDVKTSYTQIEVEVNRNSITQLSIDEYSGIAPLRKLTFDIECANTKNHFPDPEINEVITICNHITVEGSAKPLVKTAFVLNGCNAISGCEILSFTDEAEMLAAWRDYMIAIDPDIVSGFGIDFFDFKYLVLRAKVLGVKNFTNLGRIRTHFPKLITKESGSKQTIQTTDTSLELMGREKMDIIAYFKRTHKLSSYSLNNISKEFLDDRKDALHHSFITSLFKGSMLDRTRITTYCFKDCELPHRLAEIEMTIINTIELSRVTGIPFGWIFGKGQTIRVMSQLLRKCLTRNFIIPTITDRETINYIGANVFEVLAGFYADPTTVLDFASLYPSIMLAFNLCYSTMLKKEQLTEMNPDDYTKNIVDNGEETYFVKRHVMLGILPEILTDLLSARKTAQNLMKTCTDTIKTAVLNGRQMAFKTSANSVYGFTGASFGPLPCPQISKTVTATGRKMIAQTAVFATSDNTSINGPNCLGSILLAGDTDSIMFTPFEDGVQIKDVALAMQHGKKMAAWISTHFTAPIKLEFEKVFTNAEFIAKKRNFAKKWVYDYQGNIKMAPKVHMTGIEGKRRGTCVLLQDTVNEVVDLIAMKGDIQGAIKYAETVISQLREGFFDISKLIITKSLSKKIGDYKGKQIHIELIKKLTARDPSLEFKSGDRIPYVVVCSGLKKDLKSSKSEDPVYALEHDLPLDIDYYIGQLQKPLTRIFGPLMKSSIKQTSLFGDVIEVVPEHITKKKKLCTSERTLKKHVGKNNAHEIFNTDRKVKLAENNNMGIFKYTVVIHKCYHCNARVNDPETLLCEECMADNSIKRSVHFDIQINGANFYEKLYSNLWTYCQKCTTYLHQEVHCVNYECSIFFMRTKAGKELKKYSDLTEKFNKQFDW